ncbi:MAG: aquaporin [Bacteroidetes bacterium]|nr:aquaporin [Bacteroidota bacterium]
MRAMNIRSRAGHRGLSQMKASFKKNWKHYLQEALGLAIFMISACFFGGMLESSHGALHTAIPNNHTRAVIMGILMGSTALFIFYSPFTSPSGSHINPAVSLVFLRLGKMCPWDTLFFICFQFIGGTIAVFIMAALMGNTLTEAPVNYVTTVPGPAGTLPAAITEFVIAFIMITMVLFTSAHKKLKNFTRIIAGFFVCLNVIFAGPLSGFGMNPARSFASAFPSNIWTSFWIYIFIPVAGMMTAAEFFVFIQKRKSVNSDDIMNESIIDNKNITA